MEWRQLSFAGNLRRTKTRSKSNEDSDKKRRKDLLLLVDVQNVKEGQCGKDKGKGLMIWNSRHQAMQEKQALHMNLMEGLPRVHHPAHHPQRTPEKSSSSRNSATIILPTSRARNRMVTLNRIHPLPVLQNTR